MNDHDSPQTPAGGLLEMLGVVARHRRFLSRFVMGATVGALLVALLLPRWYKSTASVLPAERADLFGAMDGVSSLVKSFAPARALGALGGNAELDRFLAILRSNAVLEAVIEKFDLVRVYDITDYPREKTLKELLDNVTFTVEDEGQLTITVYDRDPQRAADMANMFVTLLNRTNTELQVQNARENRIFIEERYTKNLRDLAAAEDSLRAFQQRHGIIAMPEQTEASIKAAAEIAAQIALKEVQEGVLRRTTSGDHPSVAALRVEVEELRRKLADMNRGSKREDGGMQVFVPFDKVPRLGTDFVRRFREVEIQYKILQFLTPLYEQAKVEERRQTPSVLVLDRAVPAERKAKPRASLYALVAFVLSMVFALTGVFALEGVRRIRQRDPGRFDALIATLTRDWVGLRPKRLARGTGTPPSQGEA